MAPILKLLTISLATIVLTSGYRTKKSEKRGIADFGTGFSSSRLEGSGIKISTDFGREITLEEYKNNGYTFGPASNVGLNTENIEVINKLGLANNLNGLGNPALAGFGNLFGNGFNFVQGLGSILQPGKTNENINMENASPDQEIQEEQSYQQNPSPEAVPNNQGSNPGESQNINIQSSQNIPSSAPQFQISAQPAFIQIPQQIPESFSKQGVVQVPQPYHIQFMKPYPVNLNRPLLIPASQNVPVQQKQELPTYNIPQNIGNTAQQSDSENNKTPTEEEQKNEEQTAQNTQNADSNQIITHESEATFNKGFIPSSFNRGRSLFTPQTFTGASPKVQSSENYLQLQVQSAQTHSTQTQPDQSRVNRYSLPNGNEQGQVTLAQLQQLLGIGLSGTGQAYPVQTMYNVGAKM